MTKADIDTPAPIAERLGAGEQFNAYEHVGGDGYLVCIGPVTKAWCIASTYSAACADYLVDVLRAAAGQPESLTRLAVFEDED